MKKKRSTIIVIIIIIVLTAAISIFFLAKSKKVEYKAEMADLQGMRSAEITALLQWKNSIPKQPVEYWFDAEHFQLIPVSEPMPGAYGKGSVKPGEAVKDFEAETGMNYVYNEDGDYRDKVIYVVAEAQKGDLDISVDWVSVK